MRVSLWLCTTLNLLATPLLAQQASTAVPLLQLDRQFQASTHAQRNPRSAEFADILRNQIEHSRAVSRNLPESDPARIKAERLQALGEQWLRQPDFFAPSGLPEAHPMTIGNGVGESCASAIQLNTGDARRFSIPAQSSVWFRVDAPEPSGLRLSTRGSSVDSALTTWADCRVLEGEPIATADDSFGLQAELAISKAKQSFWFVRLDNLSEVPGHAQFAAVRAAVVSGTVARDSDSTPLGFVVVAAFSIVGANPQYVTESQTNSQGVYTLAISGGGSFALRTGYGNHANITHQAFDGRDCRNIDVYDVRGCGTQEDPYTPVVLSDPQSRTVSFRLRPAPRLIGTLVSSEGSRAIAGGRIVLLSTNGNYLRETRTDVAGRYVFESLSPGSYLANAQATDHIGEIFENQSCEPACPIGSATAITLASNQTRRIDFELQFRPEQFIEVELTLGGQPLPANFSTNLSVLNSNGAHLTGMTTSNSPVKVGPLPPGNYFLRATSSAAYPQLFEGIACSGNCLAELPLATAVNVANNVVVTRVAMDLRRFPRLSGRITTSGTAAPVSSGTLSLIDSQGFSQQVVQTDAQGNYSFAAVAPGTYLLHVRSPHHVDELFENIHCEDQNPQLNCPGATLLNFTAASTDRTIDLQLDGASSISGIVQFDRPSQFSTQASFYLLRNNGELVQTFNMFIDATGSYRLQDVRPGSFRLVAIGSSTAAQLYPLVNCPDGANAYLSCNLGLGQAIEVGTSVNITGIDFLLRARGARPVRVVSAATGLPVPGVAVDLWRSDFTRTDSRVTDAAGFAYLALPAFSGSDNTYLSTDNNLGYIDEVYNNRTCPNGSVFFGLCSLVGGTTLPMPVTGVVAPTVIALEDPELLLVNGFE